MGNPYSHGVRSLETMRLQKALAFIGIDPGPADGIMGQQTEAAIIVAEHRFGISPATGKVSDALLIDLKLKDAPIVHQPSFLDEIGTLFKLYNLVKGLQMETANVDVKSAWLSSKNWAAAIAILTNIAAFFHVVIPPDLAPQVQALVTSAVAIYIIVKNTWFSTSITTASAKKLG
jgi:peptidoglycan hydrolase-like protein with peptidoglycan-binding domain